MTESTVPGVFIIESLKIQDELDGLFEGKILRDILKRSGKEAEYWYVRTWKELQEEILQRFYNSRLRYLHISCHASPDTVSFTFDHIPLAEFAEEIKQYLDDRRLFFSACEIVNQRTADAINSEHGCYSIIGPKNKPRFDDSLIMWATFYHLTLKDKIAMKAPEIRKALQDIKTMFGETFEYF